MQQKLRLEKERLEEETRLKKVADDEAKKVASMAGTSFTQPLPSLKSSSTSVDSHLVVAGENYAVSRLKGELAYQHIQMRLLAQRHELEMNQLRDENSRLFFLASYN